MSLKIVGIETTIDSFKEWDERVNHFFDLHMSTCAVFNTIVKEPHSAYYFFHLSRRVMRAEEGTNRFILGDKLKVLMTRNDTCIIWIHGITTNRFHPIYTGGTKDTLENHLRKNGFEPVLRLPE